MAEIEYDRTKRDRTLQERGLDMERAGGIFDRPHLTAPDLRQDYGEDRFITIGYLDGRMVVFVWTWRGKNIRIISIRKANGREQTKYGPRLVGS
ncbi:BrnT family toxin [Palleronia caenipelagi]|uniref:BrnT family toxin n=1 Tax=Palleronia caenipelagi TaxID=2489174 RepID=A0A547PMT9_9RHOB|nr:BrnT family toxin [Palleronia caenipelagi]TRD15433.1 BrnT family toxin [Palleronia caenipelagi]